MKGLPLWSACRQMCGCDERGSLAAEQAAEHAADTRSGGGAVRAAVPLALGVQQSGPLCQGRIALVLLEEQRQELSLIHI